jgi:sugar phosphate isomerase/epimerase
MKFVLSAFSDEFSANFDRQLEGLLQNGISYMEIRGVDGKNISALSPDEVKECRRKLDAAGISVSSVGSPLGKVGLYDDISGDTDAHIELAKRIFEFAHILGTELIRVFSFYLPKGEGLEPHRGAVIERMGKMLDAADEAGVILCHENESSIYGEAPEACLDLMETFGGRLKFIFDPANFICGGYEPYPHAFELLKDYIFYLHIKDADEQRRIVPAGMGIGRIPEIISRLAKSDNPFYNGTCYLTVEPHLKVFAGFDKLDGARRAELGNAYETNEEAFNAACSAIKDVLGGITA